MSFTHLHLLLNHFPVIGAVLGIALLGGQVRHTESPQRRHQQCIGESGKP